MTDKKTRAAMLLRRYDALRAEMRTLEHDLAKACSEYGREIGVWGFNRDHMRIHLAQSGEKAA